MPDRRFLSRAREPAPRGPNGHRSAPAHLFEAYSQRLMTSRQVRQNIISLVGLDGAPVLNQSGEEVGRLVDLVARVRGGGDYPPVTGMVVRVGRRRAYLDASVIDHMDRRSGPSGISSFRYRRHVRRSFRRPHRPFRRGRNRRS